MSRFRPAKPLALISLVALLVANSVSLYVHQGTASALSGSSWQAGQIINDGIFYNGNDMNVDQVQAFLNNDVPTCDTWGTQTSEYGGGTRAQYGTSRGYAPPYICLKSYYENPTTHANNLSNAVIPSGGISAAQIIVNAAQTYGVSVRALLVILQKESAGPLLTDTWPFPSQYVNAMGYGCPDTAACDPQYAGFYNQVTNAARQFSLYKNNPANYRYKPQQNNAILYNPSTSCGTSTVFIQNFSTAGLYNYTPYQPNQAALNNLYGSGDSCSAYGNRNFWRFFNDWFGNTLLPPVIKGPNDGSIYVQAAGYKFYAPSVAMLQDYGMPTGPQVVSQSTLDSIPTPTVGSGISSTLGNVVKSTSDSDGDGGSIYLISGAKRYLFTTTQQMADFGFSSADIAYLPLSFIQSVTSGGTLSNYIGQWGDPTIYKVSNDTKQLVLDNATYQSLNPGGNLSQIGGSLITALTSVAPITNSAALVGTNNGAIYLYTNNAYYYVPSPDVLNCWSFTGTLGMQLYRLGSDSNVAAITPTSSLSCLDSTDSSTTYVLNGANKVTVPSSYGFGAPNVVNADLATVINKLPTRSSSLGQAIQATDSPVVWYLEGGIKKGIPSLSDLKLLGIGTPQIDRLIGGAVNALPGAGLKLGLGQVVKANDSAGIYVVTGATTMTPIASGDDFTAYGYAWNTIESFPASALQAYSSTGSVLSKYLYTSNGGVYLMDPSGCYGLGTSQVTAYGQQQTANLAGQSYAFSIFPGINLVNCKNASLYIRVTGDSTIYEVGSGQKHPISTWSVLQSRSGQANPPILSLSQTALNSLPTGSTY
jgi:hypothetical protein